MQETPVSVRVNVCPATVSEPFNVVPPVFGLTVKFTEPLPEPLEPDVTLAHDELLDAVQEHPDGAVTLTLPGPPADVKEPELAEREYVQLTPVSVKVKLCPATVREPFNVVPPVLGLTVKDTVPLPEPLAPDVIDAQFELLEAVHAQPDGAVTVTVPGPPEEVKEPEPDKL